MVRFIEVSLVPFDTYPLLAFFSLAYPNAHRLKRPIKPSDSLYYHIICVGLINLLVFLQVI